MLARIFPILGITFIDILGFSILIPTLPYFAKHFGASDHVVGLLFSVFAACQFGAGPVWGYASDRIGRKAVLIISQVGATIGWVMLAFANSLGLVFVARIVEGVSGGSISVTQAYIADLVEPPQRARAFAYVGAAFSFGMVFGPIIGGLVFQRFGFSATFLVAAALQFLTLVLTIVKLPESRARSAEEKVPSFTDIGRSLTDRRVSPVLLQSWAFSLGLYAWFGVFALLLQATLRFDVSQQLYLMASFGVLSVLSQVLFVGRIYDALGDRLGSNIGIATAAVGFLSVPFIHTVPTAIPTIVLFALGMSLARPGISSLLSRHAPDDQRGAILGSASALDNVSGVIMPPISTGALERLGPAWAGVPSLVFSSVALVMGLNAQRREAAQPAQEPL